MTKSNRRTTLKTAVTLIAALGVSACDIDLSKIFYGPYVAPPPQTPPVPPEVKVLDQGPQWTQANRAAFYTQDQGSRIMPLAWFKALRLSDGTPFTADALTRFGYLANQDPPAVGLPVGFTTGTLPPGTSTTGWPDTDYVGMTCAACHTRQIRVDGTYYRVDGGPALSNLQSLFFEMDAAVQRVLASDANFKAFAAEVLDKNAAPADVAKLRADVTAWAGPSHTLMENALPKQPKGQPWGVGRADAVGMIFNRLGGLDIGTTPDHVIAGNIRLADAPTRYPFLWNATIQDTTQWPGFAPNGNKLFGLVRNLGEVYGVFGYFHPQPRYEYVGGIDYLTVNSGNFQGLDRVEQMAGQIGEPVWPWAIDRTLADKGKALFNRPDQDGNSCATCHGIVTQKQPLGLPATWATPLVDVKTDSREYTTLQWDADSGVMNGSYLLSSLDPIKPRDSLITILITATAGAIVQKAGLLGDAPSTSALAQLRRNPNKNEKAVATAMRAPTPGTTEFKYEARVLQGIWATAPYLHNGSVPTLADLLEPSDKRPAKFVVGVDYDTNRLGLAAMQSGPLVSTTQTTGCEARDSGNSRCGHEGVGFGTMWTPDEKLALLEYLKNL